MKTQDMLQAPANTETTLLRVLDKLEALEEKIDRITALTDQAPGLLSIATDMADEAIMGAQQKGISLEARLSNALFLVEQLTAPEQVEKLQGLLKLADQTPGLVSMVTDMVDEAMSSAQEKGIDVSAHVQTGLALATRLTAPEIKERAESMLDIQALEFLATSGKALAEGSQMPVKRVGMWGLMRQLRDPDIQQSLGLLMNIAKKLGQHTSGGAQ